MKIVSLNKKKDFNLLFSKGKRIYKDHLTLIYFFCPDNNESSGKFQKDHEWITRSSRVMTMGGVMTEEREKTEEEMMMEGGIMEENLMADRGFPLSHSSFPTSHSSFPRKRESINLSGYGSSSQAGRRRKEVQEQESSLLKIAYIVSKKISTKAVVRNKIKRKMRAAARQIITDMTLKNEISDRNIFIALLSSKKILDIPFQQIYLEIEQSLNRCISSYDNSSKNNK